MPPAIQTSVKFRNLEELYLLSFSTNLFKLGNLTNLKVLFPAQPTNFPSLHVKN